MILDAKDENITPELLKEAMKYDYEKVELSKAINSPYYIILDWRDYPVEKFEKLLDSLVMLDPICEYFYFSYNIKFINSDVLLKILYNRKSVEIDENMAETIILD